jgi:aminoglycoside phosphotransferase (APT) family kinase protein
MKDDLQEYLARAFPDWQDLCVSEPDQLSAGWESDMYSFDAQRGPVEKRDTEELVLRIYPGNDAWEKSESEFRGMRELYEAGYPVPYVLLLERESSPFGKPFVIMKRIRGELLWPLMIHAPAGEGEDLLTLFCELFVDLHYLDWEQFDDEVAHSDVENPYRFVDRELSGGRAFLSQFQMAGFEPVLAWLESRRDQVPCHHPSPVHLDFHPGNILLRDDGSAVVIDWTQFGVSDSRFDLAWTLLLVGTHESMEWRDAILQEYERLARAHVEQLEFFEVFACAKRLSSVAISLSEGPEKMGMRPEAVALMKQQMGAMERVHNLLQDRTGISVPEVAGLLSQSP